MKLSLAEAEIKNVVVNTRSWTVSIASTYQLVEESMQSARLGELLSNFRSKKAIQWLVEK